MSVNKVILLGRLGNTPESRYTPSGACVVSFSLATNEKWKDASGKPVENVTWHKCQAWGKQAEALAQYAKKGGQLYVEGSVHTRSYEKDGVTRYTTEIKVQSFQFVGGSVSPVSESEPKSMGEGLVQGLKEAVGTTPGNAGNWDEELPF